ncbi:uncharacterized protein JCM15063_002579, partial [Sporobolomyces koalae]|uniref:uncharacterized protein n=1 Tax=Sporobolomyces koalae TaxID=500713 RepID=UPI0031807F2B
EAKSNPAPSTSLSPMRSAGISNTSVLHTSPRGLRPIDESIFDDSNRNTTKVSLSSRIERDSYAPTNYAPSFVSTVAANHGHTAGGSSNLSLVNSDERQQSSSPPPVPTNGIYGLSLGAPSTAKSPPKRGFLARINTMRNREKRNEEPPNSAPPPKPTPPFTEPYNGTNETDRSVWADARPNAPPVLGAVVADGPPTPPPKTSVEQTGSRPVASRASTMTTSTNPYGGIEDNTSSRSNGESRDGEVLFRGSRTYGDPGVSAVEYERPPQRREGAGPRPLRKDGDTVNDHPEVPVAESTSPARPPYLSDISGYSYRVANIVGLYEQRDRTEPATPNQEDVRLTQYGFGPGAAEPSNSTSPQQ